MRASKISSSPVCPYRYALKGTKLNKPFILIVLIVSLGYAKVDLIYEFDKSNQIGIAYQSKERYRISSFISFNFDRLGEDELINASEIGWFVRNEFAFVNFEGSVI